MKKRDRVWLSAPVFPAVLALGALIFRLPMIRILGLGLLAAAATALCAMLLYPKEEEHIPSGWRRELRRMKRTVERIQNRSVARGGREILTELTQCEAILPYLSAAARREISEYYLPTFHRYVTAYRTFEECNEGNPAILETMTQMEHAMEEMAENFRKACKRNEQTASLNLKAETAVLYKKLNTRGEM